MTTTHNEATKRSKKFFLTRLVTSRASAKLLIIGVALLWGGIGTQAHATDLYTETFESYSTGDINGQGGYTAGSNFNVSTVQANGGTKSMEAVSSGSTQSFYKDITDTSSTVYYSDFDIKFTAGCTSQSYAGASIGLSAGSSNLPVHLIGLWCKTGDNTKIQITKDAGTLSGNVIYTANLNTWYEITIKTTQSGTNASSEYFVNGTSVGSTSSTFVNSTYAGKWAGSKTQDGGGVELTYYVDNVLITDTDPLIPPDTSSRIDTFTVATSTREATITGYWNQGATTTQREQLEFWQDGTALGISDYVTLYSTTTGAFSYTFPYTGILGTNFGGATTTYTGDFNLYAKLSLLNDLYYDPFGTDGLDQSKYKTLLDSATINLTDQKSHILADPTPRFFADVPEFECSITSLGGCIKNAGVSLFYPDPQSVNNFKNLSEVVKSRFPFKYGYEIGTIRNELFNSTQTASSTVSVTIRTWTFVFLSKEKIEAVPFANTIKLILGFLLWLMAIEYIYYRVIKIHDNNSTS